MAAAFVFNMDSLVTQDYLDARFGEQEARIDARFTEQGARIEARFLEQGSRIDVLTSDMNGKFRLVYWMLTALIGSNAAMLSMVYKLAN